MIKILERTLHAVGRAYDSLIPDEETARRIGKRYLEMYNIDNDKTR